MRLLFLLALATLCSSQLPAGLVAWWPADGNAADMLSSNNGSLEGNAHYEQGIVGLSFAFSTSPPGGMVRVPPSASLGEVGVADFSFSAWAFPAAGVWQSQWTDWGPVMEFTGGLAVWISSTNTGAQGPGNVAPGGPPVPGNVGTMSTPPYVVGEFVWNHVVWTYEVSARLGKIYVNGSLIYQASLGPWQTGLASTGELQIGQRSPKNQGSGCQWDGRLDELQLYNRALTATEVADLYIATIMAAKNITLPPASVDPAVAAVTSALSVAASTLSESTIQTSAASYLASTHLATTSSSTSSTTTGQQQQSGSSVSTSILIVLVILLMLILLFLTGIVLWVLRNRVQLGYVFSPMTTATSDQMDM